MLCHNEFGIRSYITKLEVQIYEIPGSANCVPWFFVLRFPISWPYILESEKLTSFLAICIKQFLTLANSRTKQGKGFTEAIYAI